MNLLCPRGYWGRGETRNSLAALERAIRCGFGVETDIRDCDGVLVVAHDAPRLASALTLESFLTAYVAAGRRGMLALNIKADGLQEALQDALARFSVTRYFVFDMSVPDTLGYIKRGLPIAVRLSEYEDGRWFFDQADTIWLDAFEGEWYSREYVIDLLKSGKRVCVVSPELHKRPHRMLWEELRTIPDSLTQELYLCTDFFLEAMEVFNVERD